MEKFKEDLYNAIVYSYGKILSKYDPTSYEVLIKEIGKELQEYLSDAGHAIEASGTVEDVNKVVELFVKNGFASKIEVSPGENADKIKWFDLYGMDAYEKLQKETANPFLSCPLNAVLYNIASQHGKTLKLYSKNFDHNTGITESEEGLVDAILPDKEFTGIPLESNKLYELASEQRERLEYSLRRLQQEVADHKTTEKELTEQKDLLNQIIDNIPINLYLKDFDSKHLLVNKEACKTMGGDKEKIIGKTAIEILGKELGTILVDDDQKVFKGQKSVEYEEDFIVDGQTKRMLGQKIPLTLKGNKDPFLLGYSVDITDRVKKEVQLKQAKKEAELANKAKSNFLATMSHELRTPMNGVLGMAQLLLETELNDDQQMFCETIVQSGQSLTKILSDILNLSKIEAGKLGVNPEPVDLVEQSREIIQLFSGSAKAKGLSLIFNYDITFSDRLILDPQLLKQVMSNLIANAIKFTDKGQVEFSFSVLAKAQKTQKIRIEIKDTGVGISKKDQTKIFSPFTQVDDSSTRQHEGTGLGLTICQNILHLMGSKLEVQSKLGEGSLFFFELSLPYIDSEPVVEIDTAVKSKTRSSEYKGKKVLIVEDDPNNQLLIRYAFNLWGITFDLVSSGFDAIKAVKKETYNLILMDILMPKMDGFETTIKIRELEKEQKSPRQPIIAFTAKQAFAVGMDDFITKPVITKILKEKVAQWMLPLQQ